jgi:hypothetical protein
VKTTIPEWRSNLSGALSGLERLDAHVTQGFAKKRSALGWYLSAFQAEGSTPACPFRESFQTFSTPSGTLAVRSSRHLGWWSGPLQKRTRAGNSGRAHPENSFANPIGIRKNPQREETPYVAKERKPNGYAIAAKGIAGISK